MMTLRKYTRTGYLFFLTGLLIFIYGLMYSHNTTINIIIHDTYFVIANFHVTTALSIIFTSFAFVYFLFYKISRRLVRVLGILHYFFSILPLIVAFVCRNISMVQSRYHSNENWSEEMNPSKFIIAAVIVLLICLLGQILFVVNIIISLIRKKA
jgi:heme/copper-type cytochrome/quinol oxidase subunit 1